MEEQIITTGSVEHTLEKDAVVQVFLPEMFLLFLAQSPRVNPHYEDIRRESEAWLLKSVSRRLSLDKNLI